MDLCDKELPWVERCEHLGHEFDSSGSMEKDCRNKRVDFIQQAVKVKEQFQFAHPSEIITATDKYCSSHYGHLLWNLRGEAAGMLYASWRTNVKLVWNLPRQTRSYFIDAFLASGITPPQVSLMTRQVSFFHSLLNSPSPEIQCIARISARDLRSNLGSNLNHIEKESGLNPWIFGGRRMKDALTKANQFRVPEADEWRINYLRKLLAQRHFEHYNGADENEELTNIISSLVSN